MIAERKTFEFIKWNPDLETAHSFRNRTQRNFLDFLDELIEGEQIGEKELTANEVAGTEDE